MSEHSSERVGVFVDAENIYRTGGRGMRYDILHRFAIRDGAETVRLNAYVAVEPLEENRLPGYVEKLRFHGILRAMGYKVIEKETKWYTDPETGERYSKANADVDMAVDALLQSDKLDRVLLVTADGDFVQVVRALQNKGCRVEVVAFQNVSPNLIREADMFMPGYLIPNLLFSAAGEPLWGQTGSRVRGLCYHWAIGPAGGYGFFRFAQELAPKLLWVTDTRHPDSPYAGTYAMATDLVDRADDGAPEWMQQSVFEFNIEENPRGGEGAPWRARYIKRICAYKV